MSLISGTLTLFALMDIENYIRGQSLTAQIETICDIERNIAEIEEKLLVNLAVGKETKQSSVYYSFNGNIAYDSRLAVDGNKDPNSRSLSCAHTSDDFLHVTDHPFWYVDLGEMHRIHHVLIVNRGDCCEARFHDVEVTVAGPDEEYDVSCGYFKGPGKVAEIVRFLCPSNARGRYVKVQITEGERNILSLCEVEVMGPGW